MSQIKNDAKSMIRLGTMRMGTAICNFSNLIFMTVLKHSNLNDLADWFKNGDDQMADKYKELISKIVFIIR